MKHGFWRATGRIALVAAGLVVVFLIARHYDDAAIAWMHSAGAGGLAHSESIRPWLDWVYDAAPYICIPAILLALPNWKRLLVGWTAPMLLMLGLTHGLKYAIGRARPLLDAGDCAFDPFCGRQNMNSFP